HLASRRRGRVRTSWRGRRDPRRARWRRGGSGGRRRERAAAACAIRRRSRGPRAHRAGGEPARAIHRHRVSGGDMRVLITGGAGFLGSHLSDGFLARGDEVFVLDTGSIGKVRHLLNSARFHYVHDSIFNVEIIDSLVAKADLVYHLAAVVSVEHYVGDPYETLIVNVNGTQKILRAAYKYGKRIMI